MNLLTCSKRPYFAHPGEISGGWLTSQIVKAMKLTFIFLTAFCIQLSARGFSQNITLELKDAPLERVFREIQKQSGFGFLYTKKMLQDIPRVDIHVVNKPLNEVLKECFRGQSLDYSIQNNTIVITRKPAAAINATEKVLVITVTGKVTDEKGNPISSVSVVVPGTPLGDMTNEMGIYSIANVPEQGKLHFSYIGYQARTIEVKGRTNIDLVMEMEVKQLDETVVIGYGTTSKRKSTGSVSSITAEEIAKQPVANPLNALQGRIAGAVVTQQNGLPGSRVSILIRGQNSLSNGTQPLYIIDGVPFNTQDQAVPASNDLNSSAFLQRTGVSVHLV
jgi:hypothetical protein